MKKTTVYKIHEYSPANSNTKDWYFFSKSAAKKFKARKDKNIFKFYKLYQIKVK